MFARSTAIFRQPTLFRAAIRAQSTAAGVDATRGPVNPPQQQKGELVTREQAEHRESGLTTSAPSVEIVAADVLNDAPREYRLWSGAMSAETDVMFDVRWVEERSDQKRDGSRLGRSFVSSAEKEYERTDDIWGEGRGSRMRDGLPTRWRPS